MQEIESVTDGNLDDGFNEAENSTSNLDRRNNKCDNCLSAFKRKLSNITIEPVVFVYVVSVLLSSTLVSNLLIEKTCLLTFKENADTCKNITNSSLKDAVQDYVAELSMYSSLVTTLPSLWIGLFIGAYSDRNGRKLPLLLPCIGSALQGLAYAMFSYFFWISPEWCIACAVPSGLTGGFAVFMMGSFSYITDITKAKSRTTRVGLVNISISVGAPVGLFLSGLVFQKLGYWPVFLLSSCLNFCCVIYICICIKDIPNSNSAVNEEGRVQNVPFLQYVWSTTKLALYAFFRPRPSFNRTALFIMIGTLLMMVFGFDGFNLTFLFSNLVFNWSFNSFVAFALISLLVQTLGTVIFLMVFIKCLHINDFLIGLITSIIKVGSLVLTALASSSMMFYIAALVNIGGLVPVIVIRSSLTKIIPASELGKVFAMISSFEALVPIIANPLFTWIYTSTITTLPGTVFLFNAGLTSMTVFGFGTLLIMQKRGLYEECSPEETIIDNLLQEDDSPSDEDNTIPS